MTMADTAPTTRTRGVAVRAGLLAAVGSSVAAVVVGTIGKALGAAHVHELTASALISLTVVGVIIGTIVWVRISRRSPDSARLTNRIVPAVLILSFIPDLALGFSGTAWGAVITLIVAHVAVFAVTIPVLLKKLPPADLRASATGTAGRR